MAQLKLSRALVIGGTGMTGGQLIRQLLAAGISVVATSRKLIDGLPVGGGENSDPLLSWVPLDLEGQHLDAQLNVAAKALGECGANGAVILAAAYTNVDGCEREPLLCRHVNEINSIATLEWAKNRGHVSVFFSTDYVFDGSTGPYDESEPRSPINVYGRSKAIVEEWIEKHASSNSLIIRTTGVYDAIAGSKNFFMQMLEAGREGRSVKLPLDQWANPVWAKELVQATLELLALDARGIFHVAGAQVMPRHGFAAKIAEVKGLSNLKIEPITTASLNQPAKRPLRGGVRCEKLRAKLGWVPGAPADILPQLNTP